MSLQCTPSFWDCHGPLHSEYALQPFVLKLFLGIWAQSSPYLFLTEVKNFCLFLWDMVSLSSNEQHLFSLFRWEVIISELHMSPIYSEKQISMALYGQETWSYSASGNFHMMSFFSMQTCPQNWLLPILLKALTYFPNINDRICRRISLLIYSQSFVRSNILNQCFAQVHHNVLLYPRE